MRNAFDYYDNDLYLAHHRIKGMKWGIRRYQNEDGSLTAEGLRRYGNSDGSLNAKGVKALAKADYRQKRKDINKSRLRDANNTMSKEFSAFFGRNNGKLADRTEGFLKANYEATKLDAKKAQELLDAKREYRKKIGKKDVDTFMMKQRQKVITTLDKETRSQHKRRVALGLIMAAANITLQVVQDYNEAQYYRNLRFD